MATQQKSKTASWIPHDEKPGYEMLKGAPQYTSQRNSILIRKADNEIVGERIPGEPIHVIVLDSSQAVDAYKFKTTLNDLDIGHTDSVRSSDLTAVRETANWLEGLV